MQRTVIITGAGFSKPYGYPSGRELVEKIKNKNSQSQNIELKNLATTLKASGLYSIDRFLQEHPQHQQIGIDAIVDELLLAERKSQFEEIKLNEDIVRLIQNEIEEKHFNNLTIITFNYDRYLEWRLFEKIRAQSASEKEAYERMSKLNIEHIHGRMLPLSQDEANLLGGRNGLFAPYDLQGYGNEQTVIFRNYAKSYARESFKTIYTNDETPNPNAVRAIKLARRVFFLGFGFDEKNMTKLGINVDGINYDWQSKLVSGTCYGMPTIDRNKIFDKYTFLSTDVLFDCSAKHFFEEHFCITNSKFDNKKIHVENRSCCEVSAVQEQNLGNIDPNITSYSEQIVCLECQKNIKVLYHREPSAQKWYFKIN